MRTEKRNIKIDVEKRYQFPQKLTEVEYNGRFLVIANDTIRYLVLNDVSQLSFFHALQKYAIKDAIEICDVSADSIKHVLVQIEAKKFCDTDVVSPRRQHLQLFLTQSCNLRCPHCYLSAGEKLQDELSTSEICDILSSFSAHGGKNVTLTGGEICMRSDLSEIVRFAKKCGLLVELFTNGTLWTETVIAELSAFLDKVQVSIDGFDEKSNSKIRGKNNFSKALNAVTLFYNHKIPVTVAVTPLFNEDLLTEYDKYIKFAKDLLEAYPVNFRVIFTGELLDGRDCKLDSTQKKQYRDIIEKMYIGCYGEPSDWIVINRLRNNEIYENCSFGSISVGASGDVYFCARTPFLPFFANTRNVDFSKIMELSEIAKSKSNINVLKPCKDCAIRYLCGGGCRLEFFPTLTSCMNIEGLEVNSIKPRLCDDDVKNKYYDLMIRINEKLFT